MTTKTATTPAYWFDGECRYLAEHFLPTADNDTLDALAQEIQDTVEQFCANDPRSPEYEPLEGETT